MAPHPERISPWKVGWLRLKLVTLLSFWFESMDGFPWIYFHPGMWPSWDRRECHHSGRQVSWLSWVASPSGGRFFMGWNPRCKKLESAMSFFGFSVGWEESATSVNIGFLPQRLLWIFNLFQNCAGRFGPGFKVLQEDQFTLEMKVSDFTVVLSCFVMYIRVRENYRNCSMMYCI